MYFTFSKTSFYLVLFRRHCVLDLCNPDFSLSIQYSVFSIQYLFLISFTVVHPVIILLLHCCYHVFIVFNVYAFCYDV